MRNRLLSMLLVFAAAGSFAACGGASQQVTPDAGCDDPLCGGGFHDPEKIVGTLTGQALRGGAPAEGVVAHLIDSTGQISHARTDALGAFRFELSPAHYRLVLNDSHGQGFYETLVVFGGGLNDLGALELVPLESVSGIVDIHGVGFEERLTRQAGDYLKPVFSLDRSAVYVARKLGGDLGYDVLRVSIPDGAETVLLRNESISSSYTTPMFLVSDQVLALWSGRTDPEQPQYRTDTIVFLDALTGRELRALTWRKFGGSFLSGGSLYTMEAQSSREAGDSLFGTIYQYTWALARVDLATGAVQQGRVLSKVGWANSFPLKLHDAQQVVLVPSRYCETEYAMQHATECDGAGGQSPARTLVRVDLAAMTDRIVTTVPPESTYGLLSADGSAALVFEFDPHGTTLTRIDLATGAKTAVARRDCSTERCFYPGSSRSPVAEETLAQTYRLDAQGLATDPGFARIDLVTGAITELPTEATIEGTSYSLCAGGRCSATYAANGLVRVTALIPKPAGDDRRDALMIDVPVSGVPLARRFEVAAADDFPSIVTSADGSREAVVLRDLATGFRQIWTGASSSASSPVLARATFLTANHHDAAISADGDTLYYFTRDPISGYEQLFRVGLTQP
ncbi:MAG: hypothetical protein HY901_18615 [Deltaproteobacteria bacterium]|nr:hypothetical protein [Deltaproteobacteria bacterium]